MLTRRWEGGSERTSCVLVKDTDSRVMVKDRDSHVMVTNTDIPFSFFSLGTWNAWPCCVCTRCWFWVCLPYHTIGLECQGKEGDQTKEAIIYETKTTKEVVSSLIVSRERRHARRNSPVVSQSFAWSRYSPMFDHWAIRPVSQKSAGKTTFKQPFLRSCRQIFFPGQLNLKYGEVRCPADG